MTLPVPPNPNDPIPNNPFYSDRTYLLDGVTNPYVVGSGFNVSDQGTISTTGGGGGITSILTGAGLTGGPITTTGTIALDVSGVTAGTYPYATITVDAYGRVTLAVASSDPVAKSLYTGKGTVLGASSANTPVALPLGVDGQVLTADSTCTSGLKWSTASAGSVTSVTGSAPIVVSGSVSTPNVAVSLATATAPGVVQVGANLAITGGVLSVPDATSLTPGVVRPGTGLSISAGLLNADPASLATAGIVQLYDAVNSTSNSLALTANQGKNLQDQINALSVTSNLTLAGTIDGSTGLMTSVTTDGIAQGFTVGSPLVSAAAGNTDYFAIVTVAGMMTPPGGSATTVTQGDWWLSNGTAWQFLNTGIDLPVASTTSSGIVQLFDGVNSTSNTLAATPNSVKTAYDLAAAKVSCATLTAKGDLLTATGAAAPSALVVGTNGQVLTADSTCLLGLKWADNGVTSVTGTAPIAITGTTSAPNVTIDAASTTQSGAVQLCDAVTSTSTVLAATANAVKTAYDLAAAKVACSAYSAKGDLLAASAASTAVALAVGTNGQVLTADSACTQGVKWATPASSSAATPTALGTVFGCTLGTSPFSTALGCNALQSLTTGACNVAVGFEAGCALTTGAYHVAVGACALRFATGGIYNTAVGNCALYCATSGSRNVAIGNDAGLRITTANGNVAVGGSAVSRMTGACNVGVGYSALLGSLSLGTGSCNIGLGFSTGCALTTGGGNVLLGHSAGITLTSGSQNVVIGPFAQAASTTGNCQLAIGYDSVNNWLTGDSTKAIKPGAGVIDCANSCGTAGQVLMSTGANAICWGTVAASPVATPTVSGTVLGCTLSGGLINTALGSSAGLSLTTGSDNVVVGYDSLRSGTTASSNTALGVCTLRNTTTGCWNVAIGHCALQGAPSSNPRLNVAVGTCVLRCITSGTGNTFVGGDSGVALTAGNYNTVVGSASAIALTTSGRNTVVGALSGQALTAGCNTLVGTSVGQSLTTGTYNTILGTFTGSTLTTGSCNTIIGYLSESTNNLVCNQVTIGAGMNVARFNGSSVAWTFTSDARDKTDVEPLTLGLEFLKKVNPVTFKWAWRHTPNGHGVKAAGFIAQDLLTLQRSEDADYLALASDDDPDRLTASAAALVPVLVKALQELNQKFEDYVSTHP